MDDKSFWKKIKVLSFIPLIIVVVMLCVTMTIFTNNNTNSASASYKELSARTVSSIGSLDTLLITDNETGVQYIGIWVTRGIAITPRLNADGSLYIAE